MPRDQFEPSTLNVPDAPRADTLVVHALAHTHWDREWYHPLSRFRARLVALIDALLAYPNPPFLLDGQAIVLADYLAVRPERTDEIARALATGALEAGPWFVLADNLIPSGEAIVRNLEAGQRVLRRLGAASPRVAYCPDTFGHPAAMPMIAKEFGCEVSIVWRGFGGASFPRADSAWWSSPDGSRVLLHHLPPDGYEFGSALPTSQAAARERWSRVASALRARNALNVALLTCGADHHALAPDFSAALAQLDRAASDDNARVVRSSLSDVASALLVAAHSRATSPTQSHALPSVEGELRDSYGYTWTLQGTFGTRAYQKRANARLERALLRDVEPWGALGWLHAADAMRDVSRDGRITLAQIPALIAQTWESLLTTHPHDTLCGCSIDDVAMAMTARQREVAGVIPELRAQSIALALGHNVVAARERAVGTGAVVIRNSSSAARSGIAEIQVLTTIADIPVGPHSERRSLSQRTVDLSEPTVGDAPIQVLSWTPTFARRESPQHYPDQDAVSATRVLAWVAPVPAHGITVVAAKDKASGPIFRSVSLQQHDNTLTMDNGLLRVLVSPAGVTVQQGQRELSNALVLETTTDYGDSYTASPRGEPERLRLTSIRLGAKGPLRTSIKCRWDWKPTASTFPKGAVRSRERIRVWTELVLDAESSTVRCNIRGNNARTHHRLQFWWRTDVRESRIAADAAFGAVERTVLVAPSDATPVEIPPRTMPLHRWLMLHNETRSATLMSDGLAEGDVRVTSDGDEVGVTLLRATGELSVLALPERPGNAGWPAPIPLAQCIGPFAAKVGLLLGEQMSEATMDAVHTACDALLNPLCGETWRDLENAPRSLVGPKLSGRGLAASTVRVSDDGRSLILRCVNMLNREAHGAWELPATGDWVAQRCRMDGEPLGDWFRATSGIPLVVGARGVVTFTVARAHQAIAHDAHAHDVHASAATATSQSVGLRR